MDDARVKEKRQPLDKGEQIFFLFQAVTSELITLLPTGVWAPRHTSLDEALVSPFHPVAALSLSLSLGQHYAEI